jgi:hypothetical protein
LNQSRPTHKLGNWFQEGGFCWVNPWATVGVGAIPLVENGFASVASVWNGTSWFPFMFGQSTGGLFIEFSSAALPWTLSIEPQEWRTFPSLPCHPSCIESLPQCGEGSTKLGIPESCQNHAEKKKKQVPSEDGVGKTSRKTMQKHSNLCHAESGCRTPIENR